MKINNIAEIEEMKAKLVKRLTKRFFKKRAIFSLKAAIETKKSDGNNFSNSGKRNIKETKPIIITQIQGRITLIILLVLVCFCLLEL